MSILKNIVTHGPLIAWLLAFIMLVAGIILRDALSLEFTKEQQSSWSFSLAVVLTGPAILLALAALKKLWVML